MHYLITGHTGFKGAWLSMMLLARGHQVSGISLEPLPKALYSDAAISKKFSHDIRVDIRNRKKLSKAIEKISPDVVIHLAAQPLVKESYIHPLETYDTNVMGTLNLLESLKSISNPRAVLVITTDKVYKNVGKQTGYVEEDALGGNDPYSSSKASADLATQSWINSFPEFPLAIARAGNVIGGGDWSKNRIVPDLVQSVINSKDLTLRYPQAIRPWQHVLDCLNGYLILVDSLLDGQGLGEWNFGPTASKQYTVENLAQEFSSAWGVPIQIKQEPGKFDYEADLLVLDSSKAMQQLNWDNKLSFYETVAWTADWYKSHINGKSAFELCEDQIQKFYSL